MPATVPITRLSLRSSVKRRSKRSGMSTNGTTPVSSSPATDNRRRSRASPIRSGRSYTNVWSTRPFGRVCCDCSTSPNCVRSTAQSSRARASASARAASRASALVDGVAHVGVGDAPREAGRRAVGTEAHGRLVDHARREQPHLPPVRRVAAAPASAPRTRPCRRLRARCSSAPRRRGRTARPPRACGGASWRAAATSRARDSASSRDIAMSRLTIGIDCGKSRAAIASAISDTIAYAAKNASVRDRSVMRTACAGEADHAGAGQRGEAGVVVAEARLQHRRRVLAERRRRRVERERRRREAQRRDHLRHRPGERMRQVAAQRARAHLRIVEHLVEPVDRAARHAAPLEVVEPVALRARRARPRRSAAPATSRWRTRAALVAKRSSAHHSGRPAAAQNRANWPSLPTATTRWPSAHANTWYGHDVLVRIAGPARRDAGHQVVHVERRHHRDRGVEQRRVDVLAFAGAVAMRERGEDRRGRVHARHQVGDRDAGLLRPAARPVVALAGDAHEAAHPLDDEVVAGAIGVRTVLAEPGDRRVHEARMERAQRRVVETVLRRARRP